MNSCEINCIQKSVPDGAHDSITHIGHAVGRWRLSLAATIYRIEKNTHMFYVANAASTGGRAYIKVVREPGKPPYLQAQVDGRWTQDLLAQAACTEEFLLLA